MTESYPASARADESTIPTALTAAAGIALLQALGLFVAAGVIVVKTAFGHPQSVPGSLLGAGFAVLGAACLAGLARGLSRARAVARTPTVVLELLALPVAYSLTFQSHLPGYGAPILLSSLATLYLLFTPPVRQVLDRSDE
jgi:hypothetical protein